MNFNFGEILTRAWQIVWKNRVLWIFGILASCGRGGSSFNSSSSSQGDGGFDTPPDLPPQIQELFQTIEKPDSIHCQRLEWFASFGLH